MAYTLDTQSIRRIVTMIVEGWTGQPLNDTYRRVLDQFMEEEIKPLSYLELLGRMGTSGDILQWFMDYTETCVPKHYCKSLQDTDSEFVCYAA